ncbi:hypothetical protein GUJ93_ZPchr2168g22261 [Zizania palustris]|uniref:Uncharacterized protein n=1 Tax=Zizania palustris TaxID=103762 RepID=A0A8J5QZA4_ZIZPA|nr:hypothetical protein GUJ93_ZPchr2168g22261 [Zizania palustris]
MRDKNLLLHHFGNLRKKGLDNFQRSFLFYFETELDEIIASAGFNLLRFIDVVTKLSIDHFGQEVILFSLAIQADTSFVSL